jgi:hypothetical protein
MSTQISSEDAIAELNVAFHRYARELHVLKDMLTIYEEVRFYMRYGMHTLMYGSDFHDEEYEKEWVARYVPSSELELYMIMVHIERSINNTTLAIARVKHELKQLRGE